MSWTAINCGKDYSWNHADHHAIASDPGFNGSTNKTVYFGNDGGVFRTTDITAPAWNTDVQPNLTPANAFSWENAGRGIDATQFYAIDAHPAAGVILGGTQDNGSLLAVRATNGVGTGLASAASSSVTPAAPRPVTEFYNTTLDNYFITADAGEAAAIDNGSAGPGWRRTGNTFQSGGNSAVCRFYGSVSPGPNSLARGLDSNHRITSNPAAIQEVVARGWINEGVVMCSPP